MISVPDGDHPRGRVFWGRFALIIAPSVVFLVLNVSLLADNDGLVVLVVMLAVVAVVVWVGMAVMVRRARRLRAHVASCRPGAVVLPATTLLRTYFEAQDLRVRRRGLQVWGQPGAMVVLAVNVDSVELWARGDTGRPRWSVRRRPGGARQIMVSNGVREIRAICVTDETASITVLPGEFTSKVRGARAAADAALTNALQVLGVVPDDETAGHDDAGHR